MVCARGFFGNICGAQLLACVANPEQRVSQLLLGRCATIERIPLDRIYEWTWFQRQNDHLHVRDGLVSFAPNPPTFILSMVPFTTLQAIDAKRLWLVLNLVVLVLSCGSFIE